MTSYEDQMIYAALTSDKYKRSPVQAHLTAKRTAHCCNPMCKKDGTNGLIKAAKGDIWCRCGYALEWKLSTRYRKWLRGSDESRKKYRLRTKKGQGRGKFGG